MKGLLLRNYSDTTNSFIGFREANVRYFDSLGNIADCHINFEKIDEYKELSGTTEGQEKMIKELGNLGFGVPQKRRISICHKYSRKGSEYFY